MVDNLSREARSKHMARVRQAGTSAELAVRKLAHRLGYRFRVGRRGLPGNPDIVFPGRRAAVFVHGCFWHRHAGCRRTTTPKSNTEFWEKKFAANEARDALAIDRLVEDGWKVLVVWECQTSDEAVLAVRLREFLGPAGATGREMAAGEI